MSVLFFLALSLAAASGSPLVDLPRLSVDYDDLSVSGLSAGAFMAVQFHVAHSDIVKHVAVTAGGPFYCAQGQLTNALVACMSLPLEIQLQKLYSATSSYAGSGAIADTKNLANASVWIFSGQKDSVVKRGVVTHTESYYKHYVTSGTVTTVYNIDAEHGFPTMDFGNNCPTLGSPFIQKCNYDGAMNILQHAFGTLKPAVAPISENFITFDQSKYVPFGGEMTGQAFAYIPSACKNNTNSTCKLHVSLHGCKQSIEFIQDEYATKTGFNGIAEANNIIVLYPQSGKSTLKENPNGCFDWWGYAGKDYATKKGKQISAIMAMIDQLASK